MAHLGLAAPRAHLLHAVAPLRRRALVCQILLALQHGHQRLRRLQPQQLLVADADPVREFRCLVAQLADLRLVLLAWGEGRLLQLRAHLMQFRFLCILLLNLALILPDLSALDLVFRRVHKHAREDLTVRHAPALRIRALAKSGIVLPLQVAAPHAAIVACAANQRLIPHNRAIRRFHAADLVEDPVRKRPCDKLRRIPCVRSVNDICGVKMVSHLRPAAVAEYLKLWRKKIFCLVPLPCSRDGFLEVVNRRQIIVANSGEPAAIVFDRMRIIREHRVSDGIRNCFVLCVAAI